MEINDGTFIDCYNQIINNNLSGTITTRISEGNSWFVAVNSSKVNQIKQRERGIPIKNKTRLGYLIAYDGDGIDISSRMKYHRGTVQRGLSQTITTQINVGVLIRDDRK